MSMTRYVGPTCYRVYYGVVRIKYRGADKSLVRPGRKQANVSVRMAPCLAEKKNLMTARVSMLLKSRASMTCFWGCFRPGRAKDFSAPGNVSFCIVYHKEVALQCNVSDCVTKIAYSFITRTKLFFFFNFGRLHFTM